MDGSFVAVLTDDVEPKRLKDRDAIAFRFGREEFVDTGELFCVDRVDVALSAGKPVAVDEIDVDPERVVPARAAARREVFAERDEQQDRQQKRNADLLEHTSGSVSEWSSS